MRNPKVWGICREKGYVTPMCALGKDIKRSLKSTKEQVQTKKTYLCSLGSYRQSTGNWKKSVLSGIGDLGGGSLERHKYFRFLWALTHRYAAAHSLFFISLWYHCPSYIHKHHNRILFCSLTPFPSQSQEAHQETFHRVLLCFHPQRTKHALSAQDDLFQTKEKQQRERIKAESPGESAVCGTG